MSYCPTQDQAETLERLRERRKAARGRSGPPGPPVTDSPFEEHYLYAAFGRGWAPELDEEWFERKPRYVVLHLQDVFPQVVMHPVQRDQAACWYARARSCGDDTPWGQVLLEYIMVHGIT